MTKRLATWLVCGLSLASGPAAGGADLPKAAVAILDEAGQEALKVEQQANEKRAEVLKQAAVIEQQAVADREVVMRQAIDKLRKIQDELTRSGKLDEAVAIRDQITLIEQELKGVVSLPEPGSLSSYQQHIGKPLYFTVTGLVSGTIWGTGIYTSDSRLAVTAVHAGVLKPGETGTVRVTMLPGQQKYSGSTQNGVTSNAYGSFDLSYRVEAARYVKVLPANQSPLVH